MAQQVYISNQHISLGLHRYRCECGWYLADNDQLPGNKSCAYEPRKEPEIGIISGLPKIIIEY